MAGDHPNSTISKNLVRKSNQRCVVIHGTDSILVEENVAYDSVGHCFINENGVEEDIRFIKNLGALTRRQPEERRIGNPLESDHRAYTFWFTNANVRVEGNVAAGAGEFIISCGHLPCSVFLHFMTYLSLYLYRPWRFLVRDIRACATRTLCRLARVCRFQPKDSSPWLFHR
jgi:hypothetical protein